jgi:hypothetical protein
MISNKINRTVLRRMVEVKRNRIIKTIKADPILIASCTLGGLTFHNTKTAEMNTRNCVNKTVGKD